MAMQQTKTSLTLNVYNRIRESFVMNISCIVENSSPLVISDPK